MEQMRALNKTVRVRKTSVRAREKGRWETGKEEDQSHRWEGESQGEDSDIQEKTEPRRER